VPIFPFQELHPWSAPSTLVKNKRAIGVKEPSEVMQSDDIELAKIDTFVNLKGKRVLEVGCGDGRLSSFLVRKTGQLIAIDIDEKRLEKARRTVKDVDFRYGSGESLKFAESSFDLVFFGFSLHHLDGLAALSEAQRVLVPMGEILILEPTQRSEYTKLVSVFEKDEPLLLKCAARNIKSFGEAVSRQEEFVVNHSFDNAETFLQHYILSYGDGIADEKCRHELGQIIGDKLFDSPIIVEDECRIILIQGSESF
jgi:ubiquinone/menaquinone biosynthesis C-methylase UbiE